MNNLIIYLLNFFDPETAHKIAIEVLSKNYFVSYDTPELITKISSIKFKNPIGLAAGLDKSGKCFNGIFKLGFSSVEIGTVTPLAQKGNSKPRVFRLNEDRAVINRYGFNNDGMEIVKNRLLKERHRKSVLGINIGPNKNSLNPINDYKIVAKKLAKYSDYIAINVSSPNTPGLRKLQGKSLLSDVIESTKEGINETGTKKPIFLKISPDLITSELEGVVDISILKKLDAIIVSNTTVERPQLLNSGKNQLGGLSGYPLFEKSTKILEVVKKISNNEIKLIGVGGVESAKQAYTKILVGANLVQLYTGLLYQGPNIVKVITNQISEFLVRDGFSSIEEAVGSLSYKKALKLNNLE